MKRQIPSDSIALGCYAYAGIAILISVFLGADYPLSVDWTLGLIAMLWETQPIAVAIALLVAGGLLGHRYGHEDVSQGKRFRDQLDFLWEENFTAEEIADLRLRLLMAFKERDAAKEAIYARLRGETKVSAPLPGVD